MCLCAFYLERLFPIMTYTVLGGTLNPTHSLFKWPPKWCCDVTTTNYPVPIIIVSVLVDTALLLLLISVVELT